MKPELTKLQEAPSWEWPADAAATVLAALRDADAPEPDRLMATELAADLTIMKDEMADALLAVLENTDEFERVRAQAAISLGPALEQADTEGFEDDQISGPPVTEAMFERVRGSLRRVYGDATAPTEVRRRALEASVRAPEKWHPDVIRTAWKSGDELWRLTAVFCMRFVRGFDREIVSALEDPSTDIRYEAVVAAGNWQVKKAWRPVAALVTSGTPDRPLLLAAIEAAASINREEAGELLGPLLESKDEEIADAASDALTMADIVDDLDDFEEEV
jgi:HEAT repeat protein